MGTAVRNIRLVGQAGQVDGSSTGDGPQGSAVSARPAAAGRGAIDLASLPDEPYVPDGGAHD